MATATIIKKPWEMTKAEREAEIARLKAENQAVLSTPLMSEGGISPMQVGMMSPRQKGKWQRDAQQRMGIELRIKQLRASDEELAAVEKAKADKEREGRISQLNRQIADLKSMGIGKSGKLKPSYQRTLDIAQAELDTLTGKPTPKPTAKEPWEMTKEEYVKSAREWRAENMPRLQGQALEKELAQVEAGHERLVGNAIGSGKPVPAEVLKDYPELGKKETATVKDVTPKGYGPSGKGEIVSPQIEKKTGESLDEAIAREVGYQVDNGRVKLVEDRDGWKATVAGLTDDKPHVIRAYKKQQVLNEVWNYLNPSYVESKVESKPEPKAGKPKAEVKAKVEGITYYRGVSRPTGMEAPTGERRRPSVYLTRSEREAKFYGKDIEKVTVKPKNPMYSETAVDAAEKLGVLADYDKVIGSDPIAADKVIYDAAKKKGYDAIIRRDGDWVQVIDHGIISPKSKPKAEKPKAEEKGKVEKKRLYFTLKQAQELARVNPKNLTDVQLNKAYVKARDYLAIIGRSDMKQLAEGGYYASALTDTTKGVVPKDMWLHQNLRTTLSELTEERQKRIKAQTEKAEPKAEAKPKEEPKPRKEITVLQTKPTKQSDRALAIDRSLLAKQVVSVEDPRWLKHPNRFDVRGIDTPGSRKIVAGVAYSDKKAKRLSRRKHRGFRRIKFA